MNVTGWKIKGHTPGRSWTHGNDGSDFRRVNYTFVTLLSGGTDGASYRRSHSCVWRDCREVGCSSFRYPLCSPTRSPSPLTSQGCFHFLLSSGPSALTSFADLCSMYPENLGNMVFAAFPMSTLVFISSMNSSQLMRRAFPFQKLQCHYLTPCLPSFPAPQGLHK